jgi:ubiquinone/menaquinone biosynthesis C-methylase UbiE
MNKPESSLHFKIMAFCYTFPDLFSPRKHILNEAGIKRGFHVLDFGCGPGSYLPPLAELVGESGRIYALDIHPIAIKMVQGIISKRRLTNVETIYSDCDTGLPDNRIDAVLMYDVFHDLSDPKAVLKELHRVLKRGAILSFSDHHMKEDDIIPAITATNFFMLSIRGKKTYTFSKP